MLEDYRRYPIGIQNFEQLRNNDCVYVDKTELVYRLTHTDRVPGVGTKTIQSMIESGCKALVIEAGHTLLTEREKVVALADEHGITIVAK